MKIFGKISVITAIVLFRGNLLLDKLNQHWRSLFIELVKGDRKLSIMIAEQENKSPNSRFNLLAIGNND
jgi:hypothetical protein